MLFSRCTVQNYDPKGASVEEVIFQVLRKQFCGIPHDPEALLERDSSQERRLNYMLEGKWSSRQFIRISIQRFAYSSAEAYPFVRLLLMKTIKSSPTSVYFKSSFAGALIVD